MLCDSKNQTEANGGGEFQVVKWTRTYAARQYIIINTVSFTILHFRINCRNIQRKDVVNNIDSVTSKGNMAKLLVQKQTLSTGQNRFLDLFKKTLSMAVFSSIKLSQNFKTDVTNDRRYPSYDQQLCNNVSLLVRLFSPRCHNTNQFVLTRQNVLDYAIYTLIVSKNTLNFHFLTQNHSLFLFV